MNIENIRNKNDMRMGLLLLNLPALCGIMTYYYGQQIAIISYFISILTIPMMWKYKIIIGSSIFVFDHSVNKQVNLWITISLVISSIFGGGFIFIEFIELNSVVRSVLLFLWSCFAFSTIGIYIKIRSVENERKIT
jgi:hypothetical protein